VDGQTVALLGGSAAGSNPLYCARCTSSSAAAAGKKNEFGAGESVMALISDHSTHRSAPTMANNWRKL